jgi:hypothetical protein
MTALRQFLRSQPMGRASGLVTDVFPGQGLDLPTAHWLDKKTLAGMTCLALVEDVQGQTRSSRHGTRSFVFCALEQA